MIDIMRLQEEMQCDELELLLRGDYLKVRAWWGDKCKRLVQLIPIVALRQAQMSQTDYILGILKANMKVHLK